MKAIIFLLVVCSACFTVAQLPGEWTWMSGDSTANSNGVFGVQGVPDANNQPPGLYPSSSWTDPDGNFWLFGGANNTTSGGFRSYNTLWKYMVATNEWTWVKGTNAAYSAGSYGTQGVPDVHNTPGARYMWMLCS